MKSLDNEKVVKEIEFCGYRDYESAIKAASSKLGSALSITEKKVLDSFRKKWNGVETNCVSKTLIFGDQSRFLTKSEMAALVKLVRRGLINVYLIIATGANRGGYRHLWEVSPLEGC